MGEGDGFGGEGFGDTGGPAGPGPAEGSETGEGDYGGGMGISFGDVGVGDGGIANALAAMFSDVAPGFDIADAGWGDFGGMTYGDGLGSLFSEAQNNPFSELFQGKLGKGIMALLGMADKSGLVGQMGKFGSLATSPNPGKGMAQMGLSTLAGLANPALGFAMGLANKGGLTDSITSQFGNTVGLQGGQPADGGVGGMLEGLGGMYSAYRGMKDSGNMLGSLQSLYSQDSPYAQAMRQQLQRRDAAGGRRSQYGPREVELQAKLAQMASSQIPAMAQLSRQQQIGRALMGQQGINAFRSMGGIRGLQDLLSPGWGGMYDQGASSLIDSGSLGSLFNMQMDPFQGSMDQSWIPDYGDPFGGP